MNGKLAVAAAFNHNFYTWTQKRKFFWDNNNNNNNNKEDNRKVIWIEFRIIHELNSV